jgi:hypothetical protein
MLEVDNSGSGNCLYLAYPISLMYYLRGLDDESTTDTVLKKFALEEKDLLIIKNLLNTPSDKSDGLFSKKQIATIEKILGPATRELTARHTIDEFNKSPYDTPLFTSSAYLIIRLIKEKLSKLDPGLARLIETGSSNDYSDAEIYRVYGIRRAMDTFAEEFAQEFVKHNRGPEVLPALGEITGHLANTTVNPIFEQFQSLLKGHEKKGEFDESIKALTEQFAKALLAKVEDAKELSKELVKEKKLLDKREEIEPFINEAVVKFFTQDDNKFLKAYAERINTNRTWGSDEQANVLNRIIRGEKQIRVDTKVSYEPENDINIRIYHNGNNASYGFDIPQIIINNKGNAHWTSYISPRVLLGNVRKDYQLALDEETNESKIEILEQRINQLDNFIEMLITFEAHAATFHDESLGGYRDTHEFSRIIEKVKNELLQELYKEFTKNPSKFDPKKSVVYKKSLEVLTFLNDMPKGELYARSGSLLTETARAIDTKIEHGGLKESSTKSELRQIKNTLIKRINEAFIAGLKNKTDISFEKNPSLLKLVELDTLMSTLIDSETKVEQHDELLQKMQDLLKIEPPKKSSTPEENLKSSSDSSDTKPSDDKPKSQEDPSPLVDSEVHTTDTVLTKTVILQKYESYNQPWYSFFSRHHFGKATAIIDACRDGNTSLKEVVERIEQFVKDKNTTFNTDGHFYRFSVELIEAYKRQVPESSDEVRLDEPEKKDSVTLV